MKLSTLIIAAVITTMLITVGIKLGGWAANESAKTEARWNDAVSVLANK